MTWTRNLRLHQPDTSTFNEMSRAAVELMVVIQSADELCAALDDLRASWTRESIIHGDVRWDNCLALPGTDSTHWTRWRLIDWNLCGAGDPSFDVGSFVGEYLRAWLQSIPIIDSKDPGRLLAHAALPLRRMRPALRAFWDSYRLHRGATPAELDRLLGRAIRFAGVRLLTAALEEAQTGGELPSRVLYLLPLSRNILTRPGDASCQLLGLKAPQVAA